MKGETGKYESDDIDFRLESFINLLENIVYLSRSIFRIDADIMDLHRVT